MVLILLVRLRLNEWRNPGKLSAYFHSCFLSHRDVKRACHRLPLSQTVVGFFLCNGRSKPWVEKVFSSCFGHVFCLSNKNRCFFFFFWRLERFRGKSTVFLLVFSIWGTCSPPGQVFLTMCPDAVDTWPSCPVHCQSDSLPYCCCLLPMGFHLLSMNS